MSAPAVVGRAALPDPLAVVAASLAAMLTLGWGGPLVGVLFLVVVTTLPGVLLVGRVAPRDRAEAAVVVVALSLVTWMLVAHVLLSVQWWQPRLVAAAVAAALAVWRTVAPARDRPPGGGEPPLLESVRSTGWRHLLALALIVAVWASTLPRIDLGSLGDWGLATELPLLWFAALGAAVWIAARAASRPVPSAGQVASAVAVVLVIVYATVPLVSDTLRYPWTYKHLGVVRLLDSTGQLHPEVDIYNNFSGMFGLAALVRGATGVDPEAYAAWSQLLGQGLIVLAVWVVVHRLTDDVRVAHVSALVLVLVDWVGQNYFSAQVLGTFLAAVLMAMVVSWFVVPGSRRAPRLEGLLARVGPPASSASLDRAVPRPPTARVIAARRIAAASVGLGLAFTHALTAMIVLLVVVVAVAIGWVRDLRLIGALVVVFAAGMARAWPYFAARGGDLGFGGSLTDNVSGNVQALDPPRVVELVGLVSKGFAVTVWGLAVAGAVIGTRTGRRLGLAAVLAATPFALPLVQSYGGEVVYRVYLYALPGVAALAAVALVDLGDRLGRVVVAGAAVVLAAGFVVVHYGRELQNYVDPSEVAIQELLASLPDRELIAANFSDWSPADLSARYPMIQVSETWTPNISDELDPSSAVPLEVQLVEVADGLVGLTDGSVYVTLGPGMIEVLHQTGRLPIASVTEALDLLTSSQRYVVVARIDDSALLRVTR
jgi:hypothetical protein